MPVFLPILAYALNTFDDDVTRRQDSVWDKTALPVDLGAGEWEKEKKADCKLPPLHLKKRVHWQSMDRQLSIIVTGGLVNDSLQRRVG